MTCCRLLPPYIVFAGKHLWSAWICKNSFSGTRFNASPSGWVEEHVFFDWLSKQFIPFVADTPKPVLLIFDGHKAHISTRIIKLAMDHRVELLCLPPHSTTVLQPLDVVTLTKVKTAWRKLLVTHNTQTNSQKIDKRRFSSLVSKQSSKRTNHLFHLLLDWRSMARPYSPQSLFIRVFSRRNLSIRPTCCVQRETLCTTYHCIIIGRSTCLFRRHWLG